MTFYTYMMRYHRDEDSPEGDLAEDMKSTFADFPRNNSRRFDLWFGIIYDYLVKHGACYDCLRTFSECWGEYMAHETKKRFKKSGMTMPNNADRCVCCGDVIPEGRQVCPKCEGGGND